MEEWKRILWRQYGAAIEMLKNAMVACPESVWGDRVHQHEFWYLAYHTIFFLDYYLSDPSKEFAPPKPYTLAELDPAGLLPDRIYTKDELLEYLSYGRTKCRRAIAGLTESRASEPCGFAGRDLTVAELHLYTMRHVQHHAAQLNLLLRQKIDSAPRWVSKAADPL